jgi:urease accessory protein
MKMKLARTLAASLLLLPALAQAHPGHGTGASLLAGAMHPLLGADHLLALVAAGLLAWRMEGGARIAIAMAFPLLMVVGAVVGLAGIDLAITEVMILVSIAVLAVLALKPPRRLPATTFAVTALFALFHGHAHGLEAGDGIAGPSFVAGMALMSALVTGATVLGAQFIHRRLAPQPSL